MKRKLLTALACSTLLIGMAAYREIELAYRENQTLSLASKQFSDYLQYR